MACGRPAVCGSAGAHCNGCPRPAAPSSSIWRPAAGCSCVGIRPGAASGTATCNRLGTDYSLIRILLTVVHPSHCSWIASIDSRLYREMPNLQTSRWHTPLGSMMMLMLMAGQVMASWPATFLMGPGAASGVALINSVGSVGGFLGPYILGRTPAKLMLCSPTTHANPVVDGALVPYVMSLSTICLQLVLPLQQHRK